LAKVIKEGKLAFAAEAQKRASDLKHSSQRSAFFRNYQPNFPGIEDIILRFIVGC